MTTTALRDMLSSGAKPLLIDVLGGSTSLPTAVTLAGAGEGSGLEDQVQNKLARALSVLTNGDRTRTVVIFCLSKMCWLSHNVVVRAVALGYTSVYWYRGGRTAWREAGLPFAPAKSVISF
jgi:PQQ-dependent catabolism-associated CXXCW motif protein